MFELLWVVIIFVVVVCLWKYYHYLPTKCLGVGAKVGSGVCSGVGSRDRVRVRAGVGLEVGSGDSVGAGVGSGLRHCTEAGEQVSFM